MVNSQFSAHMQHCANMIYMLERTAQRRRLHHDNTVHVQGQQTSIDGTIQCNACQGQHLQLAQSLHLLLCLDIMSQHDSTHLSLVPAQTTEHTQLAS